MYSLVTYAQVIILSASVITATEVEVLVLTYFRLKLSQIKFNRTSPVYSWVYISIRLIP